MSNFGVRISQICFISFEPKMSKFNLSCKIIRHLDKILRSRLMFFALPMFNKFFHARDQKYFDAKEKWNIFTFIYWYVYRKFWLRGKKERIWAVIQDNNVHHQNKERINLKDMQLFLFLDRKFFFIHKEETSCLAECLNEMATCEKGKK